MRKLITNTVTYIAVAAIASPSFAAPKAFGGPATHIDHVDIDGNPVPVSIFEDSNDSHRLWVLPTRAKVENYHISKNGITDCETLSLELDHRKNVVKLVNDYSKTLELQQDRLEQAREKISDLTPKVMALQGKMDSAMESRNEVLESFNTARQDLSDAQTELPSCLATATDDEAKELCKSMVKKKETALEKLRLDVAKKTQDLSEARKRYRTEKGYLEGYEQEVTHLFTEISKVEAARTSIMESITAALQYYSLSVGGDMSGEFDFAPAEYLDALEKEHPNYTFDYIPLSKAELQPVFQLPVLDNVLFRPYTKVNWSDPNWNLDEKAEKELKRCASAGFPLEECQAKFDNVTSQYRSMSITGTKVASLELNQIGYCGATNFDSNDPSKAMNPGFTLHYQVPLLVEAKANGYYNKYKLYERIESSSSKGGFFSRKRIHEVYEKTKQTDSFNINVEVTDPNAG
ncbi:MAG: hypothetical protein KDD25_08025, partial [Bdellovibrionales bacterium]|nr:hypothetical protein [Bdellovibrionales bacterium]